jgi:hypothetical protein
MVIVMSSHWVGAVEEVKRKGIKSLMCEEYKRSSKTPRCSLTNFQKFYSYC